MTPTTRTAAGAMTATASTCLSTHRATQTSATSSPSPSRSARDHRGQPLPPSSWTMHAVPRQAQCTGIHRLWNRDAGLGRDAERRYRQRWQHRLVDRGGDRQYQLHTLGQQRLRGPHRLVHRCPRRCSQRPHDHDANTSTLGTKNGTLTITSTGSPMSPRV